MFRCCAAPDSPCTKRFLFACTLQNARRIVIRLRFADTRLFVLFGLRFKLRHPLFQRGNNLAFAHQGVRWQGRGRWKDPVSTRAARV